MGESGGGPGSGADDVVDDDDGGGSILPEWLQGGKPKWWDTASTWLNKPKENVREVIFGTLLGGVAYFVEPLLDGIVLLLFGSVPSQFDAPGETWGVVDVPVAFARLAGDILAIPVELVLGLPATLIDAVAPSSPGIVDGLFVSVFVVVLLAAVFRYGPKLVEAVVSAIPIVGSPVATLLFGGD